MKIYKRTRRLGAIDLILVLSGALTTGLLAGAAVSAVGQSFRSVLFTPLITGALIGGVGLLLIQWRRFAFPVVAAVIAVAAALAAFASEYAVDYLRMREDIEHRLEEALDQVGENANVSVYREKLPFIVNYALAQLPDSGPPDLGEALAAVAGPDVQNDVRVSLSDSIRGWLAYRVSRAERVRGRSGGSSVARGLGSQILQPVWLLLICTSAVGLMVYAARKPVCPATGQWFDLYPEPIPVANRSFEEKLIDAVKRHDVRALVRHYPSKGLHKKYLALDIRHSPAPSQADSYVALLKMSEKTVVGLPLLRALLPRDVAEQMEDAARNARQLKAEAAAREHAYPKIHR